ncbi:MAG: hypothetical protein ACOX5F_07730 [Anaerovoracaceae bacterium]|jgi:hypothetical protein
MKDSNIKYFMGQLLRNKGLIWDAIDYIDPEDIEQGLLIIPQNLINNNLREIIIEKSDPYLDDYMLFFENNSIYCSLDLTIKQLGKVRGKFMLNITEFTFEREAHIIHGTYMEDVKSAGNLFQSMALKAAKLKETYLETVASFLKLDYLRVDKDSFTIYLDKIQGFNKVPPEINLRYLGCNNEAITFEFNIE